MIMGCLMKLFQVSFWFVPVLIAGFASIIFSGCTVQERRGISSLPQNRPAEWERVPIKFRQYY